MSYTPRPSARDDDDLGEPTDISSPPTDRVLAYPDAGDEPTNLMPMSEMAQAMARSLPTPPRLTKVAGGTRPPPPPPTLARGSSERIARRRAPRDTVPSDPPGFEDTRPHPVLAPSKRMLGGYKVTGVLASGAMGVIYRGEHPTQRTSVAIKAVQASLQTNPAVVARFFAESVALARVVHPNVVRFCDFGYDAEGSAYLVMELLEGETLSTRLARERRLEISTAIDIAIQIAHALAAAHSQHVVHRDIKPDNIFLCSDGTVKLLDFGVAKIGGQAPTQTLQGDLLGTAAYMAPEQGRSASESDARSDLYSVGCILFEMVCGVVPFPGNLVETLVAHQTAQRTPARALNADVPGQLDALIDRLLAREAENRPQTAMDVVRALASIESTVQRPLPIPRRADRSGTMIVGRRYALPELSARTALSILVTVIILALTLFVMR